MDNRTEEDAQNDVAEYSVFIPRFFHADGKNGKWNDDNDTKYDRSLSAIVSPRLLFGYQYRYIFSPFFGLSSLLFFWSSFSHVHLRPMVEIRTYAAEDLPTRENAEWEDRRRRTSH